MLNEECVEFRNSSKLVLRGILHHGNKTDYKDVSLVCLNSGLNDMAGWHRIQVKLSRHLAEVGYNVLRFDDFGIGDSDGELDEESIVKIFSDVETGLFVQNADAAVQFMANKSSDGKLVYLGFCGGGLTGIHSAAENKRVSGVIDMGGPVTLSSKEYLDKKDPWEVRENVMKYKSKLFRLGPWLRFFSGKGEYGTVFRSITHYLKHKSRGEYREDLSHEDIGKSNNLNKKFFHSFERYAKSNRPCLFYFSEMDAATWEFRKYFLGKYVNTSLWSDSKCRFIEVEKTNHIFSSTESQQRMKNDMCNWLREFLK